MARVDSLPEDAKEVLQTGSAIEREFSYELIKRVIGIPEQNLLTLLSVLKDSELLYERGIFPQSTYIIKHALTQEVAYHSLIKQRRRDIHARIGQGMEALYADRIEEHLEMVLAIAQRAQKQKATGQLALFGGEAVGDESYKDPLEDERGKRMDRREKKWALQKEKENLGFYLSAHPLDALKSEIQAFASHSIQSVKLAADNRPVRLAGVVSGLKAKLQKNGGRMARFTLEDQEGFIEVMVFSKAFEAASHLHQVRIRAESVHDNETDRRPRELV